MHKTLPFFIENFIEYIYIFIYVYIYIYLIFFVFTNEDQYIVLYCFPVSILFLPCISLLSGNLLVFHLKSFMFDLCQQPRCWEKNLVTHAGFKMAFTSGHELKTKERDLCFWACFHKHFAESKTTRLGRALESI